jgi:hypothetical protein
MSDDLLTEDFKTDPYWWEDAPCAEPAGKVRDRRAWSKAQRVAVVGLPLVPDIRSSARSIASLAAASPRSVRGRQFKMVRRSIHEVRRTPERNQTTHATYLAVPDLILRPGSITAHEVRRDGDRPHAGPDRP